MKCPVKKCPHDGAGDDYRCIVQNRCQAAIIKDLRRAQRLIREADALVCYHTNTTGDKSWNGWKRRAVEIGAMKESK